MKITILGMGNMGTALASNLLQHELTFWTIEEDVYQELRDNQENSKYLPGIKFPNCKATMDYDEALKEAELVVLSVPSHVMRQVVETVKTHVPEEAIIIEVTKGLEPNSNKRMSEVISEYLSNPVISVGGPSIANELAEKVPTFVVYASKNENALSLVKQSFQSDYYHITTSTDVVGVELCGTLKNVIAIYCGFSDGLGYGVNTKAGLITQGLKDLEKVVLALGGSSESINGLSGLGDTVVTCMSKHSRNRRFGEKIGSGKSVNEAMKEMNQVVEGYKATKLAYDIIKDKGLDCPIIQKVYKILYEEAEVSI